MKYIIAKFIRSKDVENAADALNTAGFSINILKAKDLHLENIDAAVLKRLTRPEPASTSPDAARLITSDPIFIVMRAVYPYTQTITRILEQSEAIIVETFSERWLGIRQDAPARPILMPGQETIPSGSRKKQRKWTQIKEEISYESLPDRKHLANRPHL